MAISSALAALHKAGKTGIGDSIDISQFESTVRCLGFYIGRYLNEGIPTRREGSNSQTSAGYGCYTCKDGVSV